MLKASKKAVTATTLFATLAVADSLFGQGFFQQGNCPQNEVAAANLPGESNFLKYIGGLKVKTKITDVIIFQPAKLSNKTINTVDKTVYACKFGVWDIQETGTIIETTEEDDINPLNTLTTIETSGHKFEILGQFDPPAISTFKRKVLRVARPVDGNICGANVISTFDHQGRAVEQKYLYSMVFLPTTHELAHASRTASGHNNTANILMNYKLKMDSALPNVDNVPVRNWTYEERFNDNLRNTSNTVDGRYYQAFGIPSSNVLATWDELWMPSGAKISTNNPYNVEMNFMRKLSERAFDVQFSKNPEEIWVIKEMRSMNPGCQQLFSEPI